MSRKPVKGPKETAKDVLDYVKFAGYELSLDQLMRLHRQRLIKRRFHDEGGWRDPKTRYPMGTAERMLRIVQLDATTKKLDELAWRLWWEGSVVEPDLVRDYLVKMANHWDERLGEIRNGSTTAHEDVVIGERDVLDEVFFQHLTLVPSTAAERIRLEKGSKIYVEFAAILTDLLSGEFATVTEGVPSIFEHDALARRGDSSEVRTTPADDGSALETLQNAASLPCAEVVQSLTARQIERARPVAFLLSQIIGSVGEIMNDLFGGAVAGRDTAGKSLVAMSDSPEEQVLSLLLSSSLLKHKRIRKNLPHIEASSVLAPAVSFQDFLRLRYLVREVEDMQKLVTPRRMRNAFESPEGAERWRAGFEEFLLANLEEIEGLMEGRPDLFGAPPPFEECSKARRDEGTKSKKKIVK
jgi:hypothetical protein